MMTSQFSSKAAPNTIPPLSNIFLAKAENAPPELLTVLSGTLHKANALGVIALSNDNGDRTGHLFHKDHIQHIHFHLLLDTRIHCNLGLFQ